jgi:hypothetical protein
MSSLESRSSLTLGVPVLGDVDFVAANLRESDRKDMEGLHPGKSMREVIMGDVEYSKMVYGLYRNGSVQALFGVIPIAPGVGTPWVVGTGKVDDIPLPFARVSRKLLGMLQASFPLLDTWICARNTKSVLWHKWCGFEFDDEQVRVGKDDYFHARRRLTKEKMRGK